MELNVFGKTITYNLLKFHILLDYKEKFSIP